MNLIVKRFFVLALPLLLSGTQVDGGYAIRVENNSGSELEHLSITNADNEFNFGDLSAGQQTGLGNADLQFGSDSPRSFDVAFIPKNGSDVLKRTVEIPILNDGESVKLSINSYLDLIDHES